MSDEQIFTGIVFSAEFLRDGDSEDRPAGTYLTVYLDNPDARISAGPVSVSYLPLSTASKQGGGDAG